MVDFRKWLFALAPVGLLLGIGSATANAQTTTNASFTCTAAAGVPNILRAEGVTELLGDLTLNCTGGNPTIAGALIPEQNIQISINTNVTSRLLNVTNLSEAVLMIDEPYPQTVSVGTATVAANPPSTIPAGASAFTPTSQAPTANNAQAQLACQATNNTNCAIVSVGPGLGTTGSYNGSAGHFNIFQGYQSGVNTISWNGVPIDAPGTSGTRVIRITNVRANASQLGVSSTLIPTQVTMIVAVNGSQFISIFQPGNGNVVGQIEPGLIAANRSASFTQCNNVNGQLISPSTFNPNPTAGINATAVEGFAASFKVQNYAQYYNVISGLSSAYVAPGQIFTTSYQNIPGFTYNTESGFFSAAPSITQPSGANELVGLADTGTNIQFTVGGVGAGVSLFAPPYVYLSGNYGSGTPVGVAVLQGQGGATGGAFSTASGIPVVRAPSTGTTPAPVAVTFTGSTATLTYQIYYSDPSVLETLTVPISVAYISNTGNNLPALTGTTPSTVAINFAPLSTIPTATTGPIPRFAQPHVAANFFTINACTCNLLFPFVTNIAGFDTGVAIANTSLDPFGTSPQTGPITLNYYGTTSGGGAAPPKATTTSSVPGGQELIFTLSNGGNFGIGATPGFEGYIIATANFQFCHGFAFISDVGAQKLAEGYLAIELDVPLLNRTGLAGESQGH